MHPKDTSHPHGRVDVHVHFGVKVSKMMTASVRERSKSDNAAVVCVQVYRAPCGGYNLWMEHLDHARDGPPWRSRYHLLPMTGKEAGPGTFMHTRV